MFLDILLGGSLFMIFIQDLKDRAVSVYLLTLTLVLSVIRFYIACSLVEFVLINIAFVFIQFIGIVSYVYIKNKTFYLFKKFLGGGDVFFWGCLVFLFSPLNFLFFFVASFCFSILIYYCFISAEKTIPLAGFQSISALVFLICHYLHSNVGFYNDSLMLNLL